MPSGFESDIFFGGAIQKRTHPNGSCPFFYCDTEIHEARFAEKEEKYHLPIAKKRSL